VLVPAAGMLCVLVLVLARTDLWHVRRGALEVRPTP
jgi:hypothetical protein